MDSDSSSISEDSVDEIIAGKYKYEDQESSEEEEEALFDVDEEEDEDEDVIDNEFAIKLKKQEMESDLEDGDEGDGDDDIERHLPDPKAWGSEKSAYYNTDYVDRGKRHRKYLEEDEELANAEEEEALAIQKRLVKEMKGSDLGMEWMADQSSEDEESEPPAESIQADLSSLSDPEKMQFVKKMSPELIPLVNDMKKYSGEGLKLEPLVEFAMKDLRGSKLRKSSGFKLLKIKYDLMEKYLHNILVYLHLRSVESSEKIKKHPILGNLIKFKKLIEETDKIIEGKKKLKSEIEYVLSQLERGEEIEYDGNNAVIGEDSSSEEDAVDLDASDEEDRRGITYEMSKNKGLTAQKKKSVQNPRVKHRMKFKKALVKRKSQVREPRKEVSKYAGEFSGIKSSLVRSIKFKH